MKREHKWTTIRPNFFRRSKFLLFLSLLVTAPFFPSATLFCQTSLYELNDPTPNDYDQFGLIVGIGDVDGDSILDIAVGARNAEVQGKEAVGEAFIFSGANGSLLYELHDPQVQRLANFGSSLTGLQDVNGDSIPDVAVGAPEHNAGYPFPGRIIVFSGKDGSELYSCDNSMLSDDANLGYSIDSLGDINGDAVTDIAATAQKQVLVFSGIDGSIIKILDYPNLSLARGPLVNIGDINGDSQPEIAVRNGNTQVAVISVLDGALFYLLENPAPQFGARFGEALAAIGDVNNDSVPDIAISDSGQTVNSNSLQGQVFVFSGQGGSLLYILNDPNPQQEAFFGNGISGVGDLNNDFVADIAVGATGQDVGYEEDPGQVFIFSGVDGSLMYKFDHPIPQDKTLFGGSIAKLDDSDGNSMHYIGVGALLQDVGGNIDQGQAYVFRILPLIPHSGRFYTITQLTDNAYDDENPQINDNRDVVWSGYDGNDEEIFLYEDTSIIQLTENDYDDVEPQINDNRDVVWSGYDGNDEEIFLYAGVSIIQLTGNDYDDGGPQINDRGEVAWQGQDVNDKIFLYDGMSITELITGKWANGGMVQINDKGEVVWAGDCADCFHCTNPCEIFLYDGTSTIQLTYSGDDDVWPQINNREEIAWTGEGGVFLYYGSSITQLTDKSHWDVQINHNGEVVWSLAGGIFLYDGTSIVQLTYSAYVVGSPHINNRGVVVWQGHDGNDWEIFIYDGTSIIQLTDNGYSDSSPQINNNGDVVWEGDGNIFLAIFSDDDSGGRGGGGGST